MKKFIITIIALLTFMQIHASDNIVFCTMDAKQCSDWSWVGRTWPNCEFICPWDEFQTSKACTKEYMPVCWEIQIQCIKTPCNPIKQTFWNKCELKSNPLATYLYDWECIDIKLENKINLLWEKSISKLDENKKTKTLEKIVLKVEKLHKKVDWINLKQNILSYIKHLALKTLWKN